MTQQTILRPKQVKERLNVSRATVQNLLSSGAIPSFKLTEHTTGIFESDLEAYIQAQQNKTSL